MSSATRCGRRLSGWVAEDRDLLRKMYYEEVDSGVLAQSLGVTAGALRVRKHRVLGRLAALLNRREI